MDDGNQCHGRENTLGSKPLAREKSPCKIVVIFFFSNVIFTRQGEIKEHDIVTIFLLFCFPTDYDLVGLDHSGSIKPAQRGSQGGQDSAYTQTAKICFRRREFIF